ncbi:33350_t:CDS:2, partial [Gigaspora margarita]
RNYLQKRSIRTLSSSGKVEKEHTRNNNNFAEETRQNSQRRRDKKERTQKNEHEKIPETNMAKQQKKQKFNDDEKVELELNALKEITNIWNNSSIEYFGEAKEAVQKPSTSEIDPEPMPEMVMQVEQITEQKTRPNSIEKKA